MQKISHTEANYRAGNADKRCGRCSMFRLPARCTLVMSPILEADTCDYFKPAKDEDSR